MDVKEKIVELLGRVQQMGVIYRENQMDERYPTIEQIRNTEVADHLIANGVTVQEWIPVAERPPEEEGLYLVAVVNDHERRYSKTAWYHGHGNWFLHQKVTHWMPLPEPPKGE